MSENLDFFKIRHNNIPPEKGLVLVSEPFLQDAFFKRSVVLLTAHDEEGTQGFVLNNPIDFSINQILEDFPDVSSSVGVGGPVHTDSIHYIHTAGDIIPESEHIFGDLFWGGKFDVIKNLLSDKLLRPGDIRFFVGMSSWYPGQLEKELSVNSWMVTKLDRDSIMKTSEADLWEKVLNKEDREYQMWTKYPNNPLMN